MSAWSQAWKALCRCIVVIDQAIGALPGKDRLGGNRPDGGQILPARGRPWRRLCAQGSGWIHEWHSELARAQDAVRKKRRAERRALTLLLNLLDSQQRQDFRTHRYINVIGGSSGKRYRLRADLFANIDAISLTGAVTHRLCAQPSGDLPIYDVMAGQLLYLQDPDAEKRFLVHANIHRTRPDDYIRGQPV